MPILDRLLTIDPKSARMLLLLSYLYQKQILQPKRGRKADLK